MRSYLSVFRILFFGDWSDVPKLEPFDEDDSTLVFHAIFLFGLLIAAAGWAADMFTGHFNWGDAIVSGVAFGSIFGITGGAMIWHDKFVFGLILSVSGGFAFGLAQGLGGSAVECAAAGGLVGSTVGTALSLERYSPGNVDTSIARSIPRGVLLGTGFGVASCLYELLTVVIDSRFDAYFYRIFSPMFLAYFLLIFGAFALDSPEDDLWQPRRQWIQWVRAATLLLIMSIAFGLLVAKLTWVLRSQVVSPFAVSGVFVLVYSRLYLWPFETLWGLFKCRELLRGIGCQRPDSAILVRRFRRAYCDRLMILPLLGEAKALRQLAALDETLAICEAASLARRSFHRLVAISVLRDQAATNPLVVQAKLYQDLDPDNRQRNLHYVSQELPEVAKRIWSAHQRLHELAITMVLRAWPENTRHQEHVEDVIVGRNVAIKCARRDLIQQAQRMLTSSDTQDRENFALRGLRKIVDDFASASAWNADLRHLDTYLRLYQSILAALETKCIVGIAGFEAPELPATEVILYPQELRDILYLLNDLATRAHGYLDATSPVTRGRHLLKAQDALEQMKLVVEKASLPAGPFLALVMAHWRRLFATAYVELTRGQVAGPFPQPYIIANPVVGRGFVGRQDILNRLEALWVVPSQRPSVVLYGHRRMGKSSILQNLKGEQFGVETCIVDFNLQTFGLVGSTGVLLHNLALELYDACQAANASPDWTEPEDAPFDREPYGAFKRFLRQLDLQRGDLRFIVTMDEFETLEERIESGKLQPNLIEYLRGFITTQTWLTLAFAGLHTLQEMTKDYWHPLFGSVETIPVSFLSERATRRLLTAPSADFAIDYSQEALDFIHALTYGQPYLTQLIGHNLVTRLNEQMFEQQIRREARFHREDVDAVISTAGFYRTGGAYFSGIWAQAGQGPPGQQAVLSVLVGGPTSLPEILEKADLGPPEAEAAIKSLERHDIVVAVDHEGARKWRFIVELMRRWLSAREELLGR